LEVSVEPNLPVHGNRELVGQALANLLDNALKYSTGEEGGPTAPVTVSARRADDRVVISVGDRGPGIPKEERGRVLERFVRLEGARTRPGFGLGLSLAAAVARLHGGALILDDNDPGLRVTLSLPARAEGAP
jgi:signal transduction histidine kinase